MHEQAFGRLRGMLVAGGVAPRHVQRLLTELSEHCEDLERDAMAAGMTAAEARDEALRSLGSETVLAEAVLARTELKGWSGRWPRTARALEELAALPAMPLAFCADHSAVIARWSASCGLALLMTGSLLLSLQWIILTA
jgi:hypothetical protein